MTNLTGNLEDSLISPLYKAIINKNGLGVSLLIKLNVNVNQTFNNKTPLWYAVNILFSSSSPTETVQMRNIIDLLLGANAYVDDCTLDSPLSLAIMAQDLNLIDKLIPHCAKTDSQGIWDTDLIFLAARTKKAEKILTILSRYGANLPIQLPNDGSEFSKCNLLHIILCSPHLSFKDKLAISQFLLEKKVSPLDTNGKNMTPSQAFLSVYFSEKKAAFNEYQQLISLFEPHGFPVKNDLWWARKNNMGEIENLLMSIRTIYRSLSTDRKRPKPQISSSDPRLSSTCTRR